MFVPSQVVNKTTPLPTFVKAALVTACVTIVPTVVLTMGIVAAGFLAPLFVR